MNAVPNVSLNDGNAVSQLGFGVFQIEPKDTAQAVSERLRSATGTSTPPRRWRASPFLPALARPPGRGDGGTIGAGKGRSRYEAR